MNELASLRLDYKLAALDLGDADEDPLSQFGRWFEEVRAAEIVEPNAMTLSTASAAGAPSSRTVLLKALDDRGFTFFTNYSSRKGRELEARPQAALTFFWKELERQVNVTGSVEKVSRAESVAYFAVRPYGSQLGAHASNQSEVISGREWLEERFAALSQLYPEGQVPLPESWGGYRLIPDTVEFWQGRSSRLHDRILYRRSPLGWKRERLSP